VIRLDISSLAEGHSHQDLEEDASELDIVLDGGRLVSPVALSLEIDKSGDDILLAGRATVAVRLECARCLEEYAFALEAPFQAMVVVGDQAEDTGREGVLRVPSGAKYVDLTDEIRSELLVRVPVKPLCDEGCRGLCPTCGTNLNRDTCSCTTGRSDSRWDALKHLKKDG